MGAEGISALSEALKVNTTLKALSVASEKQQQSNAKSRMQQQQHINLMVIIQ